MGLAFWAVSWDLPLASDTLLLLLALAVPALITFFGVLHALDLRHAIAAAFIVGYLLLLFTAIVLPFGAIAETSDSNAAASIRQQLVTNFTGLMGILIGFYFGAEGAVAVTKELTHGRTAAAAISAAGHREEAGRVSTSADDAAHPRDES
jgi:hypothetical protein